MGLVETYKSWVRSNAAQIGFIDNALTSLTWLLPDRFSGSEFTAEAIDASLALLRLYNESILRPVAPVVRGREQLPWPFWLAVIREVQVLVEIGANNLEKRGICDKYDPLAALESLKAVLRYLLLYRGGGRILTGGGLWDPDGATSAAQQREQQEAAIVAAFARLRQLHGLPAIPQYTLGSAAAGHPSTAAPASQQFQYLAFVETKYQKLRQRADWLLVGGEYLHVIRPVVYVLALRSAALQASAAVNGPLLASPCLSELYALRAQRWTLQEEQELMGRRWLLAIYALRSPFYDDLTRGAVETVERGLRPFPLIGWAVGKGAEILNGIQQYYTYTSAS